MLVPNRNFQSPEYRYGFQGQEKDDEIKGDGNSLNYKFRMHDPRVGRFFAVDPLTKKYPFYSPYQFSGNKVIHAIELEGLEEFEINGGEGTVNGPYANNGAAQDAANEDVSKITWNLSEVTITASKSLTNLKRYMKNISVEEPTNEERGKIYTQVTSNTIVVNTPGYYNTPEYKFIAPQDYGTFDKAGSDGLRWKGCASCHAPNGAYRYAAYNSQERYQGLVAGVVMSVFLQPAISSINSVRSSVANGEYYSIAFEMKLGSNSYPGVSRYMHFKEANVALESAMAANPALKELGIVIPKNPQTGSIIGKSPTNWVWHHSVEEGIMQLVPKSQHPNIPGGIFWETMHPNRVGGYSMWGK